MDQNKNIIDYESKGKRPFWIRLYRKYKQLIPVLILTGLGLHLLKCLYLGAKDEYGNTIYPSLSQENYAAIVLLMLNYLFYFVIRKYYKYVLGLTLFLALLGVINFHIGVYEFWYRISFSKLPPPTRGGVQPFILLLIILVGLLNLDRIKNLFKVEIQERQPISTSNKVEKFKEKYSDFSKEQLLEIIGNHKYVSEAREAARQLLSE